MLSVVPIIGVSGESTSVLLHRFCTTSFIVAHYREEIVVRVSFDECLSFTHLTVNEIDVIAQHERLTALEAAELGEALSKTPQGLRLIRLFFEECIDCCRNQRREQKLHETLERFCSTYPESLTPPSTIATLAT